MSKLQKSAWVNLVGITVFTVILMLSFVFLARRNAKGVDYIIVGLIAGCSSAPVIYIIQKKKGIEKDFDEREKKIYKRAFTISAYSLTIFLGLACVIPFFLVGGGNVIEIVYLPLIFFGTLYTGQFVHSMAIIIQCALEEEDG